MEKRHFANDSLGTNLSGRDTQLASRYQRKPLRQLEHEAVSVLDFDDDEDIEASDDDDDIVNIGILHEEEEEPAAKERIASPPLLETERSDVHDSIQSNAQPEKLEVEVSSEVLKRIV